MRPLWRVVISLNPMFSEASAAPVAKPVDLRGMTLRERIGQTCQINAGFLAGWSAERVAGYFARHPVGGVFVGGEIIGPAENKLAALRERIALFQRVSSIPLGVA